MESRNGALLSRAWKGGLRALRPFVLRRRPASVASYQFVLFPIVRSLNLTAEMTA
jgi:hypothetical protein